MKIFHFYLSIILIVFYSNTILYCNNNTQFLSPKSNLNVTEYLNILINSNSDLNIKSPSYQNLRKMVHLKFSKVLKEVFAKDKSIFKPKIKIGAYNNKELSRKLITALEQSMALQIEDESDSNFWPRDQFTIIGGKKILRSDSELGEGGALVWSNKDRFILASSMPPTTLPYVTEAQINNYHDKMKSFASSIGFKLYFIQPEENYSHIDTSIGIIDKLKIILVTPGAIQFYNKQVLEEFARNEGYTIIETPHKDFEKCPANLINIGSQIYLFNNSQETINEIINVLKNQSVDSSKFSETFINVDLNSTRIFSDFGIRCMSNIDYSLIDYLSQNKNFSDLEIEAFTLIYEQFIKLFISEESPETLLSDSFIDNLTNELLLKSILNSNIEESLKDTKIQTIRHNFIDIGNDDTSNRLSQFFGDSNLLNQLPQRNQPEETAV
ncbi:MAG: hypothetical protein ACD_79C00234G0002 [uncultured bacterium]|nr:MAG: hypothetical protein ACD_79C00234G0002 [uncultured bacterium]